MLWHFPALRYCVGHDSRAFGDHWVSGSLKGAIHVPLHVLAVLLCSAYRAFSCSLLFQGSPSPLYIIFLYSLIQYYLVGSPLFFQFSVMGARAGAGAGIFSSKQGSWLGCKEGGLLGVLAAWVWGQQFQPPMYLDNQPPYGMKTLTVKN